MGNSTSSSWKLVMKEPSDDINHSKNSNARIADVPNVPNFPSIWILRDGLHYVNAVEYLSPSLIEALGCIDFTIPENQKRFDRFFKWICMFQSRSYEIYCLDKRFQIRSPDPRCTHTFL